MIDERLLEGLTVLIVEDRYYIAGELQGLVNRLGGTAVGPAPDVAAGFGLLRLGPMPDLAILDVNLGDGDVYPLAQMLRRAGVPFVFATGYEAWAIDPLFADVPVVEKPVAQAALIAALRRLALKGAKVVT